MPLIAFAGIVFAIYFLGFVAVRQTHTKEWFDRTTEETGAYTFFDSWSEADSGLYFLYYPMLVADEKLCHRPFDRDKW